MRPRFLRRLYELRPPDRRASDMPATSSSFLLRPLLLLLPLAFFLLYLLLSRNLSTTSFSSLTTTTTTITTTIHLLFGISASARTWPRRRHYLRSWWCPNTTRGLVFLDSLPNNDDEDNTDPPIRISADTTRFPYTLNDGQRSAIRIARIAKELVDAFEGIFSHGEVRWIVLCDDDTVFFLENLAGTLAKYDWEQWYYVGSSSESVEQNALHFFDMAFGGGGFAISYPLAKVLSKVMDSCLMRYGHLFGSDARIFACLAELGVGLTREPGFHQIDLRGDLLGLLSTHPLQPLVSLHHLDSVDPLFPGMNHSEALSYLLKAVNIDPERILQQTVCYDHNKFRTVSVSWGFAVQVFEGNQLLTDLLASEKTFRPWQRGRSKTSSNYMFNTRDFPRDPCKRPAIFFLESLHSSVDRIQSNYNKKMSANCLQRNISTKTLQRIVVSSEREYLKIGKAVRRHCCDVLHSSFEEVMNINIRKCKDDELIAMHP